MQPDSIAAHCPATRSEKYDLPPISDPVVDIKDTALSELMEESDCEHRWESADKESR